MHCELTIVVGMAILAGNTGERKSKADAFDMHMLCLYAILAAQNRSQYSASVSDRSYLPILSAPVNCGCLLVFADLLCFVTRALH